MLCGCEGIRFSLSLSLYPAPPSPVPPSSSSGDLALAGIDELASPALRIPRPVAIRATTTKRARVVVLALVDMDRRLLAPPIMVQGGAMAFPILGGCRLLDDVVTPKPKQGWVACLLLWCSPLRICP